MSKEEEGCITISHPSPDVGPCTSKNGSVVGNSGTTANGGSAIDNNGRMSEGGFATDSSGSRTVNIGPATDGPILISSKTSKCLRILWKGCNKRDLDILETEFLYDPNPTFIKRLEIARFIQKKEDQVRSWFEKRRKKQRKERGKSKQLPSTPRKQGTSSYWHRRWSEFFDSYLKNLESGNTSPNPGTGQELGVAVGEHPFVPNYKKEISGDGDGIPHQEQLRNGLKVGRDRYRSSGKKRKCTSKQHPSQEQDVVIRDHPSDANYYREITGDGDRIPQQEQLYDYRQAGRDQYHSPVNTGPSTHKQEPPPRQEVVVRDYSFVPNYYREINRDGNGFSRQQQLLPNSRQLETDRCCSPVNTNQSTNELDEAQIQKVVVREHPFVLNYYRQLSGDGHGVSQQEELHDSRQAVRDLYYYPLHQGSSTIWRNPVSLLEDEMAFRAWKFIPNYYREVNGDGYRVPCQQLPEVRHTGRDDFRCLFNPGPDTNRLHPVLGQEVGVELETQRYAHNCIFCQLEPATLLPSGYQHPYYTPLSASLMYGGLTF